VKRHAKVLVDTREDKKFVEALSRRDFEVEQVPLLIDVLISGERGGVAVERKTISDFAASIASGRIWHQLGILKNFEEEGFKPVLLLVGYWSEVQRYRRWSIKSLMSAIASIQQGWRISVCHFERMWLAVEYLSSLAKYLGKPREVKLHRLRETARRKMSPDECARFVVESLPSIGAELADRLLRHFGSVEEVFANIERIDEVRGIGKKVKKKILDAVKHSYVGVRS